MRGLYNGEIRDRTHIFRIFFSIWPLIIFFGLPFYGAVNWWKNGHILNGWLCFCVALLLFWVWQIAIGREFIFLTINKSKIILRRPLLKFSPFKKDKTYIEIPIEEIAEINTYRTSGGYGGSLWWRIISKDGKQILKFAFEPEFISSTVNLDHYFQQNGIDIKLT